MKQPSDTPDSKSPTQAEADQAAPPTRPHITPPTRFSQQEVHTRPGSGAAMSYDPETLLSALKESEARLRALMENSTDLIWIYYFDGRAAASRDYCGYSTDEWAQGGLTLFRSLHSPDSLKRLDKALEYVFMARERATNLRVELRTRHAGYRHYSMNLSPVMTDEQNVIGMQVVVHDIIELS